MRVLGGGAAAALAIAAGVVLGSRPPSRPATHGHVAAASAPTAGGRRTAPRDHVPSGHTIPRPAPRRTHSAAPPTPYHPGIWTGYAAPSDAALSVGVGVVVGNDPGARPQSGLESAQQVWEILAEGFITRYLALFDPGTRVGQIGPIRSTRIYFDQLAHAYGIPLAHAGGNVDALAFIPTWRIQNLDDIYGAGGAYWRSAARIAPDNLYTSSGQLEAAATALHYSAPPMERPPAGAPPHHGTVTSGVTLDYFNSPGVYTYIVGWTWDGTWWNRAINGSPESSASGTQLRAGTVFILVVPDAPDPDPYTPGAIKMLWQDGGQAWMLRGGVRYAAVWRLNAQGIPTVYVPGTSTPMPGGTIPYWYEVVPTASDVTFS